MIRNVLRSIGLLTAAVWLTVPAFSQPFGPFDQTADWGPRGNFKTPGEVEFDDATGTFTLRGNGDDIWNQDDEGLFVFTTRSGSWRLSAKVFWEEPGAVAGQSDWAKIGVMMRETGEDATSRHYWVELRGLNFGDRTDAQWRAETSGDSSNIEIFQEDGSQVADPGDGLFLRISRFAEIGIVTSEFSFDGVEWFPGHSMPMDFPDEIAWGLAITSHVDDENLVEATVSDVVLEQIENVVGVTRDVAADSFLPGQAVDVTLNLFNPSADSLDTTLTETLPDGFTATNISDGGTLSGDTITWDLSVPSGDSSISYTANVDANYDTSLYGYTADWSGTDGTADFVGDQTLFLITFGVGEELFSFDFEDPAQVDQWTDLAGFFDIEDGQFLELLDAGGPLVTLTGDPTLADVAVQVDATGLVGDADWGMVLRATDINNFYTWQFVNGALEFIEIVGGTRTTLLNIPFAEELGVSQEYLVVAQGTVFQLFFNGELMAIVEDDSLAEGQVGLFAWVNAGTDLSQTLGGTAYDNFVVSTVVEAADVEEWSLY